MPAAYSTTVPYRRRYPRVHRLEQSARGQHHVVSQRRAHQRLVVVPGVVEEQVESVVHKIRRIDRQKHCLSGVQSMPMMAMFLRRAW